MSFEKNAFDIRDYGAAEANAAAQNAAAMQKAIDAASDSADKKSALRECAVVVIPPGTWRTGTLWMRSHVELRLEKGAVLKASTRPEDYNANAAFPENFWSVGEEWSGGHLILGYKIEDAAINGGGTIDGCGLSFFGEPDEDSRFPHYKYGLRLHPLDRSWFRPGPLVAFFLSKDIRLHGVNIVDSPAWTTHFRCCEGVDIRRVSIRNDRTVANTDGFSIDCSRNVTVSGCTVVTGDDTLAIRASCALHAEAHPCGNILVEDCDFASCAMGARIGIGSGSIRDITIRRVRVREAANGIQFHPAWIPGKKGCYIENVRVEDCDIGECDFAVNSLCGADDWRVRDIVFERCRFSSLQPATFRGDLSHHPENIVFRDCSRIHLDHLKVRHHRSYGGERSRKFLQIEGVADVRLDNCTPDDNPHGTILLAFDGRDFDDWLALMPIFDKYGAHATYFVSGEIDKEAQQTMKKLSEAGHTVGLSGLNRLNADEALSTLGAERYWKEEIEPQHCVCRVGCILANSFACPDCHRSNETDAFFRKHGLRTFPMADRDAAAFDIDDIVDSIHRAADRKDVLVLASHGILPDCDRLDQILSATREYGVDVVGFDEL